LAQIHIISYRLKNTGPKEVIIDIIPELEQRLPAESIDLIRAGAELASEQGFGLFLVGGAVRDIFLGRPNFDLDLVVEGDATRLAKLLAQRVGGEVLIHHRFGTAKLRGEKSSIDFVTARHETYAHPGALPAVFPGSIKEDLQRRDFTINSMAIHLNIDSFGKLLDPCNGKNDLENGLIRVLHPESFTDDATRMFRAVRYEQRYSFKLEAATERLLNRNLTMLSTISADRIRRELELVLREDFPEKALRRADELGILKGIHPSLRSNGWLENKFRQARAKVACPPVSLYLSLMLYHLSLEEGAELMGDLKFPKTTSRIIADTLRLKEKLPSLATPELPSSAIYRLLEGNSPLSVLASVLASDSTLIQQRLHLYLDKLRHVKISLDGEVLMAMGVSPGPQLGEILRVMKEAKLDQRTKSREDEVTLVRLWLAGNGGG
jgi:tRNA nucleotidyltransferase (CCA-adding enzyme)